MSVRSPLPSPVACVESSEDASDDQGEGYADTFRLPATLTPEPAVMVSGNIDATEGQRQCLRAAPETSVIDVDTPLRPMNLLGDLTPMNPDTNDIETPDKVTPPRPAFEYRRDGNSEQPSQPSAAKDSRANPVVDICVRAPVVREGGALGYEHPEEKAQTYDMSPRWHQRTIAPRALKNN